MHVNLLVDDAVLLGPSDAAAHLEGHGPVPGELARALVLASPKAATTLRCTTSS